MGVGNCIVFGYILCYTRHIYILGDCALGEGVYFTPKTPNCKTENLLENNYGTRNANKEKVGGYVRVDADKVKAISGRNELGRNVFKVPGNLNLDGTNAKAGVRDITGKKK